MTTLETLLALAKTEEGLMRIRVMVAEFDGYERRPDGQWRRAGEVGTRGLPDYTGSLDAMAEVEKGMDREQCQHFNTHLMEIKPARSKIVYEAEKWSWHSSALQRAIAFILTKQSA